MLRGWAGKARPLTYVCSRVFMEKRMGQEVAIDSLGEEFAGYVVRITGGNDKQGFPMKQGMSWTEFMTASAR